MSTGKITYSIKEVWKRITNLPFNVDEEPKKLYL